MADFARIAAVEWKSEPLVSFLAMLAPVEARFGPPTERDLDSNGAGLFDSYLVRFPCGLEVALWRMHLDARLAPVDAASQPSTFDVYASERDVEHILFHLRLPITDVSRWERGDGAPADASAPRRFVVMRADDNGNRVEVARLTSRCEADAVAADFEARGHKQTYWVERAS